MLHYWVNCLTKSERNGYIYRRKELYFIMTMHHLTHRTLHSKKAKIGFRIASANIIILYDLKSQVINIKPMLPAKLDTVQVVQHFTLH